MSLTINKVKLPSGNVYEIEDSYARQLLAGGLSFEICWDGNSAPVVANIPAGVKVKYNNIEYIGTKPASSAEPLTFYLVYSNTQEGEKDVYDEYVASHNDWEKIGDTRIDIANLGALAYKDNVTLSKGSGDNALGEDATFSTSVTPSTSKLETTSVPNVTNVGSPTQCSFTMGSDEEASTLIIGVTNGSAPTLGTPITVATGSLGANASGATVATGITSASTQVNSKDAIKVAVYDDLGVSVS